MPMPASKWTSQTSHRRSIQTCWKQRGRRMIMPLRCWERTWPLGRKDLARDSGIRASRDLPYEQPWSTLDTHCSILLLGVEWEDQSNTWLDATVYHSLVFYGSAIGLRGNTFVADDAITATASNRSIIPRRNVTWQPWRTWTTSSLSKLIANCGNFGWYHRELIVLLVCFWLSLGRSSFKRMWKPRKRVTDLFHSSFLSQSRVQLKCETLVLVFQKTLSNF